ncbi:hypothetical protein ACROYT_G029812 [Oculina patagonica]
MNFCWTPEPSNNFRETVEVGRYGVYNPDATIYYTSSGRGAFSIRDGGQILWEQKDGRDRRLTVFTRNGYTFDITRRKGGEFSINGGWICQEKRVGSDRRLTVYTSYGHTFDITRRKGGGSEGYHLNTRGFWRDYRGRSYF